MEQALYFHGIPGDAGELGLFGDGSTPHLDGVRCIDRTSTNSNAHPETYFKDLADAIQQLYPETTLRLIGFSLGASAALRIAPFLGDQVSRIDLVSAAAPLTLGSYLDTMAGGPVFKLARSSPLLFRALAKAQSLTALIAPGMLYDALFASAQGADKALSQQPDFKAAMVAILRNSLGAGHSTYHREIALYVKGWETELDHVTQPVTLYHGQLDNWSPVAMAHHLEQRLPRVETVCLLDGLSHYTTLREYWQRYFTQPRPMVS